MSHVLRWVEETGADAVEAIRNLERGRKDLSAYHLRCLRQLLTPAARHALLPTMLAPGVKLQDVERAADRLVDEMWLDFNWQPFNEYIHPDVCMSPVPSRCPSLACEHAICADALFHPSTCLYCPRLLVLQWRIPRCGPASRRPSPRGP